MNNTYAIDFQNPKTGERRTVVVQLTDEDLENQKLRRFYLVHASMESRARRELPEGFERVYGSMQSVTAH
jgi:hypothetical protein